MADHEETGKRNRSEWRLFGWGAVLGVVIIALMVAAFAIGYNRGEADAIRDARAAAEAPPAEEPAEPPAGEPAPPAAEEAAVLFGQACGACHVLGVADTTGTIGPDLDLLAPSSEQVLAAIENGGSGTGQMPAGLLQGDQAALVAEFVAQAAAG